MEGNTGLGHLSELQKQELEILKEFIRICEKNELRYFMAEGSMLGTLRHHGFIPWDDDVDVAMPRRDYNIFCEIANKELPGNYYFSSPRDEGFIWISSRITSKKGGFIVHPGTKDIETGAWVDILVIDGVPDPGIQREIHWYHYRALRALYQVSLFSEVVNQKKMRPFYEKAIIRFVRMTGAEKLLDTRAINRRLEKLLCKYDYDACEYVAMYSSAYRKKEIVKRYWYGNGRSFQFENIRVMGLDYAEAFLAQVYGDYLTPPKDRVGKHAVTTRGGVIRHLPAFDWTGEPSVCLCVIIMFPTVLAEG